MLLWLLALQLTREPIVSDKKPSTLIRLLKIGAIVLVVLVVGIVVVGFMLDDKPHISSSIVIDATPEEIHEWVGDLRKWDDWGPWREDDPDMTYTYTETTTEVGDRMEWVMNQGTGNVSLTATDPQTGVEYMFQWGDTDPAPGYISYAAIDGGKTEVTWGTNFDVGMNILGRYMMAAFRGVMVNMYDKGLSSLKDKVEGGE
jgi:hypothetical protein